MTASFAASEIHSHAEREIGSASAARSAAAISGCGHSKTTVPLCDSSPRLDPTRLIYGPKTDGTYFVEFTTAGARAAA
jgi:hypothetical protein